MWDLIVSVPDHCLSFYFASIILLNDNINVYIIKILFVSVLHMKVSIFLNTQVPHEQRQNSTVWKIVKQIVFLY